MSEKDDIITQHHQEIGRKGGRSKSPAKSKAARRNLAKALEARWKKKYPYITERK